MSSAWSDIDRDLLERIPLTARTVLDVGCRAGLIGAAYKRANPRAWVLGIESDADLAQEAAMHLDKVIVAPLETDRSVLANDIPPGGFDCIVYANSLQHMTDPWNALCRQIDWLAHDGVVLVRVPNGENWLVLERLLRGTWDHNEEARLGRGSLRWFSHDALRRAFGAAGLHAVESIAPPPEESDEADFVESLSPALLRLGIDAEPFRRRVSANRQLWRAQRAAVQPINVVHTMLNPVGGVSQVRVVEPVQALATDPTLRISVVGTTYLPTPGVDEPGIFVLHRPLLIGGEGIAHVRHLVSAGWLVVCEFDDHPDYIPVLQRPDIQNFRAVHAIQTSTEPLAAVLRQQNPEVAVFPNAIARLPDPVNFRAGEPLSLMFAGLNREAEWPPYLDALNAVAERAGDRLHFRIVNDRGLFDALSTSHKTFTPLCDYDTYLGLLSHSEISFMPLLDTPFNRCKSDLKFIEASAHRVTAVASRIVYARTVDDGHTGLLFGDGDELWTRLSNLVASPDAGRAIAGSARRYVAAERMLAYQVSQRSGWYHELWARREELQRSLLARVPELA
jgi:SAM-dependent methyltransferase